MGLGSRNSRTGETDSRATEGWDTPRGQDFRFVYPEFLLFPTYEHQKEELIKPEFHAVLRDTYNDSGVADTVDFKYFCHVTDKFELRDEDDLDRISGLHIWMDDYATNDYTGGPNSL